MTGHVADRGGAGRRAPLRRFIDELPVATRRRSSAMRLPAARRPSANFSTPTSTVHHLYSAPLTISSALGKTGRVGAFLHQPRDMIGMECRPKIVLIWLRSIQAALHVGRQVRGVGLPLGRRLIPASTMMYLLPILSTITVSGIGMNSVVRPALASASFVSSTEAFLMKVGSCGLRQIPSYTAVTSIDPTLLVEAGGQFKRSLRMRRINEGKLGVQPKGRSHGCRCQEDHGETWLALTFSLKRVDRADRTTPLSNVSVTNEIVAARRLFPLRRINFDGREETLLRHRLTLRWIPAGCRARDDRARSPNRRGNTQRLNRKLSHPVKQGGERLIVCAGRARKSMQAARAM